MAGLENTILLCHPPTVEPAGFLSRLLERDVDDEETVVPWTIDNKYYTAEVSFLLVELDHEGSVPPGVEVIVFVFDQTSTTIPPGLIKSLVDDPKDIALAIRIETGSSESGQTPPEEWTDPFEEVGFEVIDENAVAEEDDERPISPLETIRQTLMTHLWPSMKRKPVGNGTASILPAAREPAGPDVSDDEVDAEVDDEAVNAAGPSTFPISFKPTKTRDSSVQKGPSEAPFPNLAELRAQIEMDDFERFGTEREIPGQDGRDRLSMLDEMLGGPGEEEYARLDAWLDEDDEDYEDGFRPLDEHGGAHDGINDDLGDEGRHPHATTIQDDREIESQGHDPGSAHPVSFEDDFDDFAAFQSAPVRPQSYGLSQQPLTADPTPLLLHLQTVRAELAGMDEEERRIRAGQEVARVMRDLGFDDIDASDLLTADEGVGQL